MSYFSGPPSVPGRARPRIFHHGEGQPPDPGRVPSRHRQAPLQADHDEVRREEGAWRSGWQFNRTILLEF